MTEPVNVERSKRLSITSLPLHAIPEHEQYRRRPSQEDHTPTPDNTSPDSSPRSSPFEKERRGELGSSMEDDAAVKKRKKKLFHNLFRRSSETVVIPEEKEEEKEAAPERGLTFTYSSPLPAPGLAASSDGNLSSSPNRRPPLAASAPAGAFCLSPVNSPSLSSSPAPSHPHYAHQSNSMGKKTGLDKLKAMMKDKPNGSPEPQEFTSSVFALVSPRDSRKEKDTKEKDTDTKEKHEHKEKHKDKSKKKDKEKDKDKDRDDGSATPEKKKGFLTFSRRRSVSTGASTIQPPPREHVSSPSLLSSITSSATVPTITSLRELDPEVPLEFDLPPQCKESLEALMKDPPGVRLFYAFCVKENYDNMLQFWNQARYFQRGGTYAGDAVNELRSGAIASDALNDMLGAPMPSGDVKLEAEALFYTYIANGSPSEMSIQPIIRAQLDKHIHEGTIHRDMFDRLTRSVYDEISREPYARFIKLFDPEKLQQEFIQRKHSASNPPPPILPPASPTLTSLRSLVRRASTPSAPLLSPTFLQNPAYAQGAGSSAFHPLAATNAHHSGSASSSQPGSAHVSPHNSMLSLPNLQIPPQMHTPPHHLHTPPHTPPYHGGYQPPPSPTHAHYHNLYSHAHSPSPSHHLFNSNFAPSSSSPHPLSHSLHAQHTMSMSTQYSSGFPSSPPHHPLSLSSHYPSSSPANHHPLAYYAHHPPSPITVPQSPGRHGSPSPPFPQPPSSPSTARHPLSHSATSQPPLSKSASPRLPSPRELHALSRKLSISIPPLDVAPPPAPTEKYGVAFKIKRGACQPPCDCEYYQPPGDNGGPCQNCGHFPATHVNLGKVDALSTSPQEKMAHTPPLSLSIASIGSASTSSSNLMASVNTSPSNSSSNLLSPTIHNHPLASSGGRKDSLGGKGDLNPLGGFVPISPTQDGETEDIFSGMSNWKLDADEITFSDKIGEGSAAKVYKGVWRNQEVAIKILKNAPDSSELSEFKKELEIMSSLRSPYIIYFFGMVLRPKVCMLMEYCGRKSLYHVMNTKGELGWDRVFAFVAGAVRGINALHNWSPPILHRDLKSLNLLITDNWAIRIADFGLSRFHTGDLATLSKVRGTYAYCAPEVYFGQQYTTKSDIYSMGIVIWELVTRCLRGKYERPFAEHKHIQYDFQIIIQAAKENLRPTIPPTCPEGLANIIRLCLDPNPEIRPSGIHLLEMVLDCEKAYTDSKKKWDKVREKPKS